MMKASSALEQRNFDFELQNTYMVSNIRVPDIKIRNQLCRTDKEKYTSAQ